MPKGIKGSGTGSKSTIAIALSPTEKSDIESIIVSLFAPYAKAQVPTTGFAAAAVRKAVADLMDENPAVVKETKKALKYWLTNALEITADEEDEDEGDIEELLPEEEAA